LIEKLENQHSTEAALSKMFLKKSCKQIYVSGTDFPNWIPFFRREGARKCYRVFIKIQADKFMVNERLSNQNWILSKFKLPRILS